MREQLSLGLIVAILTGAGFGVLTTIEGGIGRVLGAINTSLLEHLIAGIISIVAVVIVITRGEWQWSTVRPLVPLATLGAVMVIIAVAGVAYAFPRAGVVAASMGLTLGQMTLALLIDTIGLFGYERLPITIPRIAGLLLMVAGTFLVLPKST